MLPIQFKGIRSPILRFSIKVVAAILAMFICAIAISILIGVVFGIPPSSAAVIAWMFLFPAIVLLYVSEDPDFDYRKFKSRGRRFLLREYAVLLPISVGASLATYGVWEFTNLIPSYQWVGFISPFVVLEVFILRHRNLFAPGVFPWIPSWFVRIYTGGSTK